MWFLWELDRSSSVYNLSLSLRLRGALDRRALAGALDDLCARHEPLRTTLVSVQGQAHASIASSGERGGAVLEDDDLRGMPEDMLIDQLRQRAAEPFDLESGPLWRAVLWQVADDAHLLMIALHHIVSDGWSMAILQRDLGELYAARVEDRPAQLAALTVQYADYAAWQSARPIDDQVNAWCRALDAAPQTAHAAHRSSAAGD